MGSLKPKPVCSPGGTSESIWDMPVSSQKQDAADAFDIFLKTG
jgi:hypothetical protein